MRVAERGQELAVPAGELGKIPESGSTGLPSVPVKHRTSLLTVLQQGAEKCRLLGRSVKARSTRRGQGRRQGTARHRRNEQAADKKGFSHSPTGLKLDIIKS